MEYLKSKTNGKSTVVSCAMLEQIATELAAARNKLALIRTECRVWVSNDLAYEILKILKGDKKC